MGTKVYMPGDLPIPTTFFIRTVIPPSSISIHSSDFESISIRFIGRNRHTTCIRRTRYQCLKRGSLIFIIPLHLDVIPTHDERPFPILIRTPRMVDFGPVIECDEIVLICSIPPSMVIRDCADATADDVDQYLSMYVYNSALIPSIKLSCPYRRR